MGKWKQEWQRDGFSRDSLLAGTYVAHTHSANERLPTNSGADKPNQSPKK